MTIRLQKVIYFFLLVLVVLAALSARLAVWWHPYWMDEAHHLRVVYGSVDFWDLREQSAFLFIPILELVFRKYFWANLLGISENAGRLPSLFFSLATVFTIGLFSTNYCFRKKMAFLESAAVGLTMALWVAFNEHQIHYGVEARSYSYISFISLLWFFSFFCIEKPRATLFFLLSFLFLNAHFFSTPFVVFGYLYRALEKQSEQSRFSLLINFMILSMLLLSTAALNFPSLYGLTQFASNKFPHTSLPLLKSFHVYYKILKNFWYSLGFPSDFGIISACLLSLLTFLMLRRNSDPIYKKQFLKLSIFLWAVLTFTLISIKSSSDYVYNTRYYFPYFGLGSVFLLFILHISISLKRNFGYALLTLLAIFLAVNISKSSFSGPSVLKQDSSYFSIFSKVAEAAYATKATVLIVAIPNIIQPVERLYFDHFLKEKPKVNFIFSEDATSDVHDAIIYRPLYEKRKFEDYFLLNSHRSSWIILVKDGICPIPIHSGACARTVDEYRFQIDDIWYGNSCVWVLHGVENLLELRQVAYSLGFPPLLALQN